MQRTGPELQRSLAQNEQVDHRLLALDFATDVIDSSKEADVASNEGEGAFGVERPSLGNDAIGSFLRATDEVHSRLRRVFREREERVFSDPTRGANEDGD